MQSFLHYILVIPVPIIHDRSHLLLSKEVYWDGFIGMDTAAELAFARGQRNSLSLRVIIS